MNQNLLDRFINDIKKPNFTLGFINELRKYLNDLAENITFSIVSREDDYTFLSYGINNENILKIPNKLISYWAYNILYYD